MFIHVRIGTERELTRLALRFSALTLLTSSGNGEHGSLTACRSDSIVCLNTPSSPSVAQPGGGETKNGGPITGCMPDL